MSATRVSQFTMKETKPGGDKERVATEEVLEQIYKYYCFEMKA